MKRNDVSRTQNIQHGGETFDVRSDCIVDVAIWCSIPPPLGGMTVHVYRLLPRLKENDLSYRCYCFRPRKEDVPDEDVVPRSGRGHLSWALKQLFGRSPDIHYVFSSRLEVRVFAALLNRLRDKKVILRVGNSSLEEAMFHPSGLVRLLTRFSVQNVEAVIGVNERICEIARASGADPAKVYHIPGFIPPNDDGSEMPAVVDGFWTSRSPRLLAIAYAETERGREIYGLDRLFTVIDRLRTKYSGIGVVFAVYGPMSGIEKLALEKEVADAGLERNILVIENQGALWPFFRQTDVFLRPTTTDGDANSIREALSFKVPVVASDCVSRPDPVLTYETGNDDELVDVLSHTLDNLDTVSKSLEESELVDNSNRIVELVQALLAEG